MYVCMHACMHAYACRHLYSFKSTRSRNSWRHVQLDSHDFVSMYVYAHTHTRMGICIHRIYTNIMHTCQIVHTQHHEFCIQGIYAILCSMYTCTQNHKTRMHQRLTAIHIIFVHCSRIPIIFLPPSPLPPLPRKSTFLTRFNNLWQSMLSKNVLLSRII